MTPWLDQVGEPADLRRLPESSLPALARELRAELLSTLNVSGGHLGSNLGAVELTLALHYVFETPRDKIVFDTGHQAYVHKILTGRRSSLASIRRAGGLAPFPCPEESPHDAFGTGHGGTALSAAMGLAGAGRLSQNPGEVIAVVGDGALTSGLTLEAFNHLGDCGLPVLILLNDNGQSISPTVGAFARWGPLLSHFNLDYRGPIDGHNLELLVQSLRELKGGTGPRLLHIRTVKGQGYPPAQREPLKYHAVAPGFWDQAAETKNKERSGESACPPRETYSRVLGDWLCRTAEKDPRLAAVTPAMGEGSGLGPFSQRFPQRFFDVGMAEQHALTLAAGLAAGGGRPVAAVYSTFLQRAYDQLIHDIALPKLPVILALDRAGASGPDGATHGGFFDLSFLGCVPGLSILAPADGGEFRRMLDLCLTLPGPSALRYPRGDCPADIPENEGVLELGKAKILRRGRGTALLAFGSLVVPALEAGARIGATVVNMRCVKPLDTDLVRSLLADHQTLVTLEENNLRGGAGTALAQELGPLPPGASIRHLGLPDRFLPHGDREALLKNLGLDPQGILACLSHRFLPGPTNQTKKPPRRTSLKMKGARLPQNTVNTLLTDGFVSMARNDRSPGPEHT